MTLKGTTICAVRKDGKIAVAGDGQVTMGESTIFKATAHKVRRIYGGKVVTGTGDAARMQSWSCSTDKGGYYPSGGPGTDAGRGCMTRVRGLVTGWHGGRNPGCCPGRRPIETDAWLAASAGRFRDRLAGVAAGSQR